MSGIMMMVIAIVVLGGAYLLYGRYLQNKWGIDPKAKTPAYEMEDGVDYVPADTNVVFGHQFASIAGAGPINGPIQAAIFGWLPVLLWILIGGVFFGAVQDFASMYASVKNKGRTIGYIIEAYTGNQNIYKDNNVPCSKAYIHRELQSQHNCCNQQHNCKSSIYPFIELCVFQEKSKSNCFKNE